MNPELKLQQKQIIIEHLFEGHSLRKALRMMKEDGHTPPSRATVYCWLNPNDDAHDPVFLDQYAQARNDSADADFEEIEDLARDVQVKDGIDPQRARVAIDALKWTAARKQPRKYTERFVAELEGHVTHDRPHLDLSHLTDEELIAYKKLHAKIRERNDPNGED